jgi:nitrite reductase/ring-hydroxylating ferredoxin subunit
MRSRLTTRRSFCQGSCRLFTLAGLGLADTALALPISMVTGAGADAERRYPLPANDGVNIDRGAQVILVRYAGKVYAMALSCPHENAAVKWLNRDRRFQCSKHDSQYTPEGVYTTGHATRNLDRFPVRREQAQVVVTIDRVFRSDHNAAGWQGAVLVL